MKITHKFVNFNDIEAAKENLKYYFMYQEFSNRLLREYCLKEPSEKTFQGKCPLCERLFEGSDKDLIVRRVAKHVWLSHMVPFKYPKELDLEYFEDFVEESV